MDRGAWQATVLGVAKSQTGQSEYRPPPQHTHTTWLGGMARLCPGGGRGLALKAPCARAGGCGGGVGRWWLGVGPDIADLAPWQVPAEGWSPAAGLAEAHGP